MISLAPRKHRGARWLWLLSLCLMFAFDLCIICPTSLITGVAAQGAGCPVGDEQPLLSATTQFSSLSDKYGATVAACGDTRVVGAYEEDAEGDNRRGGIYIYREDVTGTLTFLDHFAASSGAADDRFGWDVDCGGTDGTTVIASAYRWDGSNGNDQGAIFVFQESTPGAGDYTEVQTLEGSNAFGSDRLGTDIAIEGDFILGGAPFTNGNTGTAFLYENSGGTWTEIEEYIPSNVVNGDRCGWGVDLCPGRAFVGCARDDSDAGSVFVFDTASPFTELAKLVPSDGGTGEFGGSVNVDCNTMQVVAGAVDSEKVYIFDEVSADVWSETVIISNPGAAGNDFGYRVAIQNGFMLGCAPLDDGQRGYGYLYEEEPAGTWTQVARLNKIDEGGNDKFCQDVSMTDTNIFLGTKGANTVAQSVYDFKYAAVDVDDCVSAPCANGGICADSCATFVCDCTGTGYNDSLCNGGITGAPTTPTEKLCDNSAAACNGTFVGFVDIECVGSVDNENDTITYYIETSTLFGNTTYRGLKTTWFGLPAYEKKDVTRVNVWQSEPDFSTNGFSYCAETDPAATDRVVIIMLSGEHDNSGNQIALDPDNLPTLGGVQLTGIVSDIGIRQGDGGAFHNIAYFAWLNEEGIANMTGCTLAMNWLVPPNDPWGPQKVAGGTLSNVYQAQPVGDEDFDLQASASVQSLQLNVYDGNLAMYMAFNGQPNTHTPPTGYTEQLEMVGGTNDHAFAVATRDSLEEGSEIATATWSGAWRIALIAGVFNSSQLVADYLATETTSTYTAYNDLSTEDFIELERITVAVTITEYNPIASSIVGTVYPQLEMDVFDGTNYQLFRTWTLTTEFPGNRLQTTPTNFTAVITDAAILTAWLQAQNTRLRFRTTFMDSYNETIADEVTLKGLYVSFEARSFNEIGFHEEGEVFTWNLNKLTPQSFVNIRCRATDVNGSSTYSTFSDGVSNMTVIPDTERPQYSNIVVSPATPSAYTPVQVYDLSLTWTDDDRVTSVVIQHNFTGDGSQANETMVIDGGDSYSMQFNDLAVGCYYWKSIAFDRTQRGGSTPWQQYCVEQNTDFTGSFVTTSLASTIDPYVSIGETVTYRGEASMSEGDVSNVIMAFTIAAGMEYVSSTITYGGQVSSTLDPSTPVITNSNMLVTFDFGTVTNIANGAGPDANDALTVDAVFAIRDANGNGAGVTLQGVQLDFTTDPAVAFTETFTQLQIVEPLINLISATRSADTGDGKDTLTFTVTISQDGLAGADAYDLSLTASLAAEGYELVSVSVV